MARFFNSRDFHRDCFHFPTTSSATRNSFRFIASSLSHINEIQIIEHHYLQVNALEKEGRNGQVVPNTKSRSLFSEFMILKFMEKNKNYFVQHNQAPRNFIKLILNYSNCIVLLIKEYLKTTKSISMKNEKNKRLSNRLLQFVMLYD